MDAGSSPGLGSALLEVASAPIPTPYGEFRARAFESASGHVHLALVFGEIGDGESLLTRLHSECLTGDALGSLRCDCGVQLRTALRTVAAEGRGVLLYLADAAVAVRTRVAEGAAERPDLFIDRQVGVQQTPEAEQLGAGADPRVPRAHEQGAGAGFRQLQGRELDLTGTREQQPDGAHVASPPRLIATE